MGGATTLTATFTGGTGLIEGLGPVESGVPISTGALTADTTYTFTLTVTGEGGTATATLAVQAVAAPTIVRFVASAPFVASGAATTLTATFAGGTGSISNGIGEVTSGAAVPTPAVTAASTYTLTVTNAAGDVATATTAVSVATEFFASDYGAGKVYAFTLDSSGDAVPLRTIGGATTGLARPRGLAVMGDELFVAEGNNHAILVFDASADGNVAPKRAIKGGATTLGTTAGVLVADGKIYVGDHTSTVKVFSAADDGNVAPTFVLQGPRTELYATNEVALDDGELYTANYGSTTVGVFPANATGDTPPTRSLFINNPLGIVIHGSEAIVSASGGIIATFDKQTGAEVRRIAGTHTGLGFTDQCAVLGEELFCSEFTKGVVVFPIAASGDVAPTRTVKGPLLNPLGFAFH